MAAKSAATVECGSGDDRVVSNPWVREGDDDPPFADPLLGRDCDLLRAGHRGEHGGTVESAVHPQAVSVAASGEIAFHFVEFDCCRHNLRLTRAESPFEEFDSEPLESQAETLAAPGDVAARAQSERVRLRAVALDNPTSGPPTANRSSGGSPWAQTR